MFSNEFISITQKARQNIEQLQSGQAQTTYFRIETMADAKRILSQATAEDRIKRSETFLDGLEYRSRIPQGMHDRGEAYVFANHPLASEQDDRGLRNHLPVYVRAISVLEKTVKAGEVWDVTLSPNEWERLEGKPPDEREEMYNIVNVGRLVLEKNASVVVRGNAFVFTCQELVKEALSENEYDVGILGTSHGFGFRRGSFDGKNGKNGNDGVHGNDGIIPPAGRTFLGTVLPAAYKRETMNGCDGEDGKNGENGEDGLNGGACRITEINIRKITGDIPVVIGVISGSGGNGGHGGNGGSGGNGGHGADGLKLYDGTIIPNGKAGKAGKGGNGGGGGKGGNSGISSNVFVSVPLQAEHLIKCYAKAGKTGIPGSGGIPGKSGKNGRAGMDINSRQLAVTCDIPDGVQGRQGRQGRQMPPAKIYINNNWINRDEPYYSLRS
jgi:hypothetical protein